VNPRTFELADIGLLSARAGCSRPALLVVLWGQFVRFWCRKASRLRRARSARADRQSEKCGIKLTRALSATDLLWPKMNVPTSFVAGSSRRIALMMIDLALDASAGRVLAPRAVYLPGSIARVRPSMMTTMAAL